MVPMSSAVVLGSAFHASGLGGRLRVVHTPFGPARVHEHPDGWVLYRHGLPHRWLPHQIPWRAQAMALKSLGVDRLLVTSSVGVLDPAVPLDAPLLVEDVLWPDMRLPSGAVCTVFDEGGAHLVLEDGLVSSALNAWLRERVDAPGVTFAYVPGPRTKTPAENRWWAAAGAQVNSMSVGPELVLASELEIPAAALVVGHKLSHPDHATPDRVGIAESLDRSRAQQLDLVQLFLRAAPRVEYGNSLYGFR